MMVCDEEISRLAKAVVSGDVLTIALLLDRLYELGDKRGEHLHVQVGFLLQQASNTSGWKIGQSNKKYWTDLTSWLERMFWPEMHGGVVPALEKVKGLLEEVL